MIDEDEIIAAYIRTNYPEMLKTPAFMLYKATYCLIVPFIDHFKNLFQIENKEDEDE